MSRHWSAKADANQPEIVKALRAMGAAVEHLHRLKNLCDLLVTYKGVTVAVEIKAKPLTSSVRVKKKLEADI